MPALTNAMRERFAQEMANGKSVRQAYKAAGYVPDERNAHKLSKRTEVIQRIAELRERREEQKEAIEQRAVEIAAIDKARTLTELGALAFADIRDVLSWGSPVAIKDPETGEYVRNAKTGELEVTHQLALRPSDLIPEATARAIKRVAINPNGILVVEMHDKIQPLKLVGQEIGMFIVDAIKNAGSTPEEMKRIAEAKQVVNGLLEDMPSQWHKAAGAPVIESQPVKEG